MGFRGNYKENGKYIRKNIRCKVTEDQRLAAADFSMNFRKSHNFSQAEMVEYMKKKFRNDNIVTTSVLSGRSISKLENNIRKYSPGHIVLLMLRLKEENDE